MSKPAGSGVRGLHRSLQFRLLGGTLVWIILTIIIAGWGLGSLFRHHVERQFTAELKTHLDQLTAGLVFAGNGEVSLSTPLSDPRLSKPYSGLYWQIDRIADQGVAPVRGALRSRSLWDDVLSVPEDTLSDGEIHQHRVTGPEGAALGMFERMVFSGGQPDRAAHRYRLIVAADEQLMVAPLDQFNNALWLALGALGIGLVLAALVQVAVGLAPLRRLRVALGAVRTGKAQQLEGDFPAEISPLVEDFNTVLAQNAEIVVRARTQAGNLAHALKTPLSVLANAVARSDGVLADLVKDQVEAARRQVDYHLMRARAAGAASVPGCRAPLQPVLDGLVRVMLRVHAGRALDIRTSVVAAGLVFGGEEQDLQEMLGNLLDNACKWATHVIECTAIQDEGRLIITLDDDGPGIDVARRKAMMARGARADEQVAGSGLGLAIVDDLARLYGGRIELADSPLGGSRAVLILPAAHATA